MDFLKMFTFFLHFFFLLLSKCIVFVGVLRYVNVFIVLKIRMHNDIIYPRLKEILYSQHCFS